MLQSRLRKGDSRQHATRLGRPSSCKTCRSSPTRAPAVSAETVTENSTSILSSIPARSFGRILVPRRFQISGGTLPVMRSVRVSADIGGLGPGTGLGSGPGVTTGLGAGSGTGGGAAGAPALSASAVAFLSRNTPDSTAGMWLVSRPPCAYTAEPVSDRPRCIRRRSCCPVPGVLA